MVRKLSPIAVLACAGLCASALAGPNPAMLKAPKLPIVGPSTTDGPDVITLSNNIAADGRLVVNPDMYGAVTVWGWPANYDFYDPAGGYALGSPMFASSVFVYRANTDRLALGAPAHDLDIQYNLSAANPATMTRTLTSPLVGSDADGDGVIDTGDSAFTITGGGGNFNLAVTLKQRVYKPATGTSVARFQQIYTITNNAATAANFQFNKHIDGDLLWFGSAEDVAGSVSNSGKINPYQREPDGSPAATASSAIGLVSPTTGYVYYAGRSGFDPDGAGPDPAMAYGTDFQIWNNKGLPASWANYTAGIGTAPTVGELPDAFPVGGAAPNDSFMGLYWNVTIAPGAQKVIEMTTVYGARTLAGCYPDCNGDGVLGLADFGCFQTKFALGDPYADCNGDGILGLADFGCFQTKFALGCP
jgi:hypothetical protein